MGPDEIAAVASLWTGIPVQQLTADETMLLVGLEEQLRKRVIGQDDAVNAISRAVKRSRIGLKDPDRPIAAMLFCGPTGVGKTELTKALAGCYFGSVSLYMYLYCLVNLCLTRYPDPPTIFLVICTVGYMGYFILLLLILLLRSTFKAANPQYCLFWLLIDTHIHSHRFKIPNYPNGHNLKVKLIK